MIYVQILHRETNLLYNHIEKALVKNTLSYNQKGKSEIILHHCAEYQSMKEIALMKEALEKIFLDKFGQHSYNYCDFIFKYRRKFQERSDHFMQRYIISVLLFLETILTIFFILADDSNILNYSDLLLHKVGLHTWPILLGYLKLSESTSTPVYCIIYVTIV